MNVQVARVRMVPRAIIFKTVTPAHALADGKGPIVTKVYIKFVPEEFVVFKIYQDFFPEHKLLIFNSSNG
jgi:hypothetical protein